ncbi:CPBP family intramembrane glutamic endopeptidase [Demequina subtropica]|uniref:CPBP family intramembrane glutamic endopeptidase n=1 Tax=Demequina subtropica TaxID=1638989 RepID=UPI0007803D56|nr:CPBP family intramembrane glutamic endopeptidase [Demequina subtropica]
MSTTVPTAPIQESLPTASAKPDLPLYAGPFAISGGRWLVVVAACAVAFAQLSLLPIPGGSDLELWVHAILFPLIPLLALAWAAPRGWTQLFRKVRARQVLQMLGFAALNLTVSLVAAITLNGVIGANANPAGNLLAEATGPERLNFLAATIPQLLGEELITILPLLALMSVLVRRLRWSRGAALAVAWIATAVMFGLLHLPTYGWNVLQCLVFIAVARLFLTLAYVVTRNLWVSTGAHILNDWAMFSVSMLAPAAFI